jgi:hypothetical protein
MRWALATPWGSRPHLDVQAVYNRLDNDVNCLLIYSNDILQVALIRIGISQIARCILLMTTTEEKIANTEG